MFGIEFEIIFITFRTKLLVTTKHVCKSKDKNIKFYHATETLDYGDQKLFVPLPIKFKKHTNWK